MYIYSWHFLQKKKQIGRLTTIVTCVYRQSEMFYPWHNPRSVKWPSKSKVYHFTRWAKCQYSAGAMMSQISTFWMVLMINHQFIINHYKFIPSSFIMFNNLDRYLEGWSLQANDDKWKFMRPGSILSACLCQIVCTSHSAGVLTSATVPHSSGPSNTPQKRLTHLRHLRTMGLVNWWIA